MVVNTQLALALGLTIGLTTWTPAAGDCLPCRLDDFNGLALTSNAAFGDGVSVDGDIAVIGAENQTGGGAAYVFVRDTGCWILEKELHGSGGRFGHDVHVAGDTILIAASQAPGTVHVLGRDVGGTGNWGPLTPPITGSGGGFAHSVSMSGDTIVVTAPQAPGGGAAHVYEVAGGVAVPMATLSVPGIHQFGNFGRVQGDLVLIGASNDAIYEGAAYVFQRPPGGWTSSATPFEIRVAETDPVDAFGFRGEISGDTIVIGAQQRNNFRGVAYVFQRVDHGVNDWEYRATLAAPSSEPWDLFGNASISGDIIAVGARNYLIGGAVLLYSRHEGGEDNWGQIGQLTACDAASGDEFGQSVDVDGDTIVIGARKNAPGGAAYVAALAINDPPACTADLTLADAQFLQPSQGSYVITAGETFTAFFDGEDADGDELVATLAGLPAAATLSPDLGPAPLMTTLEWTPDATDKAGAPYQATVTFTDPAGEFSTCEFVVEDINLRPACDAGGGPDGRAEYEAESLAGAEVTLNGSATDEDDDDAALMYHWDAPGVILDDPDSPTPTGVFPIGITPAMLTVADGRGGVSTCSVTIVVEDTTPPEVMCTVSTDALWPPNHTMRNVTLVVTTSDACQIPDPLVIPLVVTVRSDEPDNADGNGDGDTTGDMNGTDAFSAPVDITELFSFDASLGEDGAWVATIQLRAERAGTGDGRAYTIDVEAFDSFFNVETTSCVVVVPHDRRNH